jgi:hypothetical protein
MANKFQVKRTTVSGRTPNTTNSGNSHFIDTGELALNLTDGKMFSSNGTVYFEIGANLQNISIASNATFDSSGKIVANGSFGTAGQVLTSNGTTMYWSTVSGGGGSGTVTQVNTGIGLSGGPITTTGTISVVANDGIVANSSGLFANAGTGVVVNATGIHVNSSYIGTLAANSATYVGGNTALDLRNYSDTVAGTAYTNATAFAANATNISSGTLDAARLPATVVQNTDSRTLSGNLVISGTYFNPSSNTVLLGNSIQRWIISGNSGSFSGNVSASYLSAQFGVSGATLSIGGALTANSSGAVLNSADLTFSGPGTIIIGAAGTLANSSTFKVQTNFTANTLGAYHTGTINAASLTTLNFRANTSGAYPLSNSFGIALGSSTQRWVINANTGDFSGTVAAGNTTITGFANASVSVNSALLTVGTSFIANTTGAYHTGIINAASLTVGSNFVANSTAIVGTGFANISTSVNSALLTVGTSFVANTTGAYHTGIINAASFSTSGFVGNTTVIAPTSNTILLGNSIGRFVISANTGDFTGTVTGTVADMSTSVNSALLTVGTSFVANTTGAYHTGTINAASFTTTGLVANATAIAPTSNTILLGNSIGRFVISADTINASGLITGSAGANITGTANLVDVNISGNLTVSGTTTYVNTTNLNVGDNIVTLNADLTNLTAPTENAGLEVNRGSAANVNFLWNETSDSWTLGNTDITGYANVTTSVNSALLTVGTSFIANSTAIVGTGYANISTSVNSALLTVGTSFVANTTGAYHTGTINSASFTTTNFTANTSGAYPLSNSAGTALGSSTKRWVITANTGNFTGTVTGTVANLSTSVNSALLTVGTSFIANTTGAYHTGAVNAASLSIGSGSFTTNSSSIVLASPVTANGSTGTSGYVLTSNGSSGSPYWAAATITSNSIGRTVTSYTGNGSNTTFDVTYTVGNIDVYQNGIRLIDSSDYNATSGTQVIFNTAPSSGDNIDFIVYSQATVAPVNARTVTNYTADGSTSTYSVSYEVGYLDVYVNGIRLSSGVDFTATNGSSVTFTVTPLSSDYIELVSQTVAPLQGNGSIRTTAFYTGDGITTSFDINYDNGYLDVYVNGTKYKNVDDYTATNGTSVTILSAPLAGDNIELVSYKNNVKIIDLSYVQKNGDTMTGTLLVPALVSSGNVSGVNGYFTTVNAASHTIGSIFIANTTGAYHTGTVNAASHTIGSSFIANTTGTYHTGTTNAASYTVGSNFIANTTGAYHTGTVNAASHTIGASFIANTTGVYHTGTINAASITIGSSSFIANSTAVVIADPLTANGTTGTSGQVLTSNGTTGSPYWANTTGGGSTAFNDVSTNDVRYVLFANQTSGTISNAYVSSSKLQYNPSTGTLTSVVITSSSDERMKQNVETIYNSNDVLNSLRGVSFERKDSGKKDYGVIAQEIEKVIPEIVHTDSDGYKSVSYNSIIGFLIEGLKNQNDKINNLENLVNKLIEKK